MKSNNYFQSVRKAFALLSCFSPQQPAWSGNEIAARTGMHRTTAYRMLSVLAEEGILERNEEINKYVVGPALFSLGSLYLNANTLYSIAEPVVKAMNDLTGEQTDLAIMDGKGNITFIMLEQSKHALRVGFQIGISSPAYAHALGKAMLAELAENELDRLYPNEDLPPLTKRTVPTKTLLKQELEEIRKSGFAYNNQQAWDGVEALAAVIRDRTGKTVAATSIGIPSMRMNDSWRKSLSSLVKLSADLISYRLGYHNEKVTVRTIEELRSWWEQNNNDAVTSSVT